MNNVQWEHGFLLTNEDPLRAWYARQRADHHSRRQGIFRENGKPQICYDGAPMIMLSLPRNWDYLTNEQKRQWLNAHDTIRRCEELKKYIQALADAAMNRIR